MSHTPPPSPWRSLRTLERCITVSVWALCAGFLWAGVRAWSAGAGITMMIVALILCAVAALALPHVKHAVFKHITATNGSLDDEWRRYNP